VFDFDGSDPAALTEWRRLVSPQCDFVSFEHTSALFFSFTAYDYVSGALVFTQLALERFGAQVSQMFSFEKDPS
jgi:hypothetical protein